MATANEKAILAIVSELFGIDDIAAKSRDRHTVLARSIAALVLRQGIKDRPRKKNGKPMTRSWPYIAELVGRDHSSTLLMVRQLIHRYHDNPHYKLLMALFERKWGPFVPLTDIKLCQYEDRMTPAKQHDKDALLKAVQRLAERAQRAIDREESISALRNGGRGQVIRLADPAYRAWKRSKDEEDVRLADSSLRVKPALMADLQRRYGGKRYS